VAPKNVRSAAARARPRRTARAEMPGLPVHGEATHLTRREVFELRRHGLGECLQARGESRVDNGFVPVAS
jgi:hypothetical protein